MLKHLRSLAVASAISAVMVAGAHATVLAVDFNNVQAFKDDPTLTLLNVGASPVIQGLSFSSNNGDIRLVNAVNPSGAIPANSTVNGDAFVRGLDFTITLAQDVHVDKLSFDISRPSAGYDDPYTITLSGSSGGSQNINSPNGSGNLFSWTTIADITSSVGEIRSISFKSKDAAIFGSIGIDNLSFSLSSAPAVVPEPAGVGLVILALFAAFGVGVRRKQ